MTERVSVERVIAAPKDAVWALVADVTRMGEWSPETVGCAWIGLVVVTNVVFLRSYRRAAQQA